MRFNPGINSIFHRLTHKISGSTYFIIKKLAQIPNCFRKIYEFNL